MSDIIEPTPPSPEDAAQTEALQGRRSFMMSLGKWSGAAILAVVGGSLLASAPDASARSAAWVNGGGGGRGGWINSRGGGGGGWINGGGGGGGWVNRSGGWINGGGGWINSRGGGGSWVNRW